MRGGRTNNFDFLRLFAAVAVVVSHTTDHFDAPVLWVDPGDRWWFYDGVPAFFIISGYLVYKSAIRCEERGESMWQYGWNRFLRIVPALVVWAVVVGCVWAVTGFYARNGSLWTIPAETSFYVAVPVVLWLTLRIGWGWTLPLLLAVTAAGVGAGVAYDLTGDRPLGLGLYTFVPWALFFLLGMLWFRYEARIPLRPAWAVVAVAAYVVFRSADVLGLQDGVGDRTLMYVGAVPLCYVVFFVAYRGPAVLARIPKAIGDLSYGTYIWHMFIINVVLHYGWEWPTWTMVPATLAVAAVSWWLIERPSLGLKHYTSAAAAVDSSAVAEASSVESR